MDNLTLGLKVAAIGIVMVFVVLLILMAAIKGFEKVIDIMQSAKKSAPVSAPAAAVAAPVAAVASEDDGEIVAVITAAIMAILESENNGTLPSFQIKKIKQIKRN